MSLLEKFLGKHLSKTIKRRGKVNTFIIITAIVCGFALIRNTYVFLTESGEESKKAGMSCIILLLMLFMLVVSGCLKDILEILSKLK